MLQVRNLHAKVCNKEILRGVDLDINIGEIHVIMGPNGSGKSTFAQLLAGYNNYKIKGSIIYEGRNLLDMSPEERAVAGIFLAFQYPVEIPGIGNLYFIRTALNAVRKQRGLEEISAVDFLKIAKEQMNFIGIDQNFINRSVNEGFSGGEKKRNEILQMSILEPKLAILDEIDSGLDVDALQVTARAINLLRNKERVILIVTHYQRLLNYVVPDYVHLMVDGRIMKSGRKEFALELEQNGYATFESNKTWYSK